jgi:hypothetical protein
MPAASTQLACSAGTGDVDAQPTLLTALYPTRAKHAGVGIPTCPCVREGAVVSAFRRYPGRAARLGFAKRERVQLITSLPKASG